MGFQDFEKIEGRGFLRKCKFCGAEVPTGIISLSNHWVTCSGKDFYEAMLNERSIGVLDIDKIKELQNKHLNH